MGLLLSPDHTATLTDPLTWKDNPFVARDTRRDIKKRQPFISFCWMCGVLLLVGAWAASLLWSVSAAMGGTPLFIGGDLGTGLCVVISGVHVWFILGASRKHTARLFTQESNQNTLSSLLMLPISPFQILVQAMAYPWIVAMRMAVALLPVYAMCVGLDGPTWLELLMLYVVFAMVALAVPYWKRPALSENLAILAPPKQSRFGLGPQQAAVGQEGSTWASVGTSGAMAVRLLTIPLILSWIMMWQFLSISGGREGLHPYLPNSIISLLNSVVVSWPLILARLLVTPLDWFGFAVIPLPFVLVLFLLGKYAQSVQASEYLSVGAYRDLPLQSTYRPRMRLVAGLRVAMALVVTGYLWKFAVVDGALAAFAPRVVGGDPGLCGFAYLVLCFAALWGFARGATMGQWQRHPLISGERNILCRNSLMDGVRYLCEPFVFAVAYYLVCCLLAHTEPFPRLVNATAGDMAALFMQVWLIGLSGSVLSFGVSRLFGAVGVVFRIVLPCLIGLGVFYCESFGVRNWVASFPQAGRALAFVPLLRKLEIFSPFLGMLHSVSSKMGTVQRLLPGAPSWDVWVCTSLGVGGTLWFAGHLLGLRKAASLQDRVTLVFNPTVLGREVFSDPDHLKKSGMNRNDTPFVALLIARLQRVWDNAVVIREMRSRLRGWCDRPVLFAALTFSTLVSLLLFHPAIATWPTVFGGGLAYLLMGPSHNPLSATAAGILGCWYLVLFVMAAGSSFSTMGAFYSETEKSTFGFLLSTPMNSRSIVLGKLFGVLAPSLVVLAALSIWTLMLTILFLPMVGPLAALGWFYAVLTALTWYLMTNSFTFAISALFPRLAMAGTRRVYLLILWLGSWPFGGLYFLVSAAFAAAGLHAASLWLAFIIVGWGLISVAYLISISSIQTMRRRDLIFATSKRNN
jgi:hypothetical protein